MVSGNFETMRTEINVLKDKIGKLKKRLHFTQEVPGRKAKQVENKCQHLKNTSSRIDGYLFEPEFVKKYYSEENICQTKLTLNGITETKHKS